MFADCGLAERAVLLGTDVSSTAIDVARRGEYGAWSFRHNAADWRERSFARTGKRWTIAATHRRVEFAVHNLMHPAPARGTLAGGFDLILLPQRAALLRPETVERAAQVLLAALARRLVVNEPTDPPLPSELGLETMPDAGWSGVSQARGNDRTAVLLPVLQVTPRKADARSRMSCTRGRARRPGNASMRRRTSHARWCSSMRAISTKRGLRTARALPRPFASLSHT